MIKSRRLPFARVVTMTALSAVSSDELASMNIFMALRALTRC